MIAASTAASSQMAAQGLPIAGSVGAVEGGSPFFQWPWVLQAQKLAAPREHLMAPPPLSCSAAPCCSVPPPFSRSVTKLCPPCYALFQVLRVAQLCVVEKGLW